MQKVREMGTSAMAMLSGSSTTKMLGHCAGLSGLQGVTGMIAMNMGCFNGTPWAAWVLLAGCVLIYKLGLIGINN